MDSGDQSSGALGEAVVFLYHFRDLADGRQLAKVMYSLEEILLLALLGVLAGAETFVDITRGLSGFPCAGGRLNITPPWL